MNKFAFALAAGSLALAAPSGAVTLSWTNAQTGAGFAQTVGFNGMTGSTEIPNLGANITFTLLSVAGSTWNFNLSVDNNILNSVDARLSGLGFGTTPGLASASLTGTTPFAAIRTTGNFQFPGAAPGPSTPGVELCFTAAVGQCAGNGGGVLANTVASQDFAFTFAGSPTSVSFENFFVRWQSIEGVTIGGQRITSGYGVGSDPNDPFGAVPEPSSWAMLIAGFGLVGAVARRRKSAQLTVTA